MEPVVQLEVKGVVVGLFQTNCYLVGSRRRGEAVCIDPGDDVATILALARDLGVRITRIVASHAHLDHVLAVRALQEATGAPFLLHADDVEMARLAPRMAALWLGTEVPPPPEPDFRLRGGEDLEVAGVSLRVIHTPGHTPGSVALYAPGLLFSGDTLFRGTIGRTDLPGGDHARLLRTLVDRLLPLPDDTVVLPGHMEQTTIRAERADNPFVREALRLREGEE